MNWNGDNTICVWMTKFATIKWYNLCLQIIQSQTCYPLIIKTGIHVIFGRRLCQEQRRTLTRWSKLCRQYKYGSKKHENHFPIDKRKNKWLTSGKDKSKGSVVNTVEGGAVGGKRDITQRIWLRASFWFFNVICKVNHIYMYSMHR